ncbi:MAG: TolC family protein [Acidobacteriota bacterium]
MYRILLIVCACCGCLSSASRASAQVRLSLKEAEMRALDNHPLIRASQDIALAAGQVVRETKSAYYPTAFANVTGAGAEDGSRITAGALNNPSILDRFATGVIVSQLVTDFGRTGSLVQGQTLRADAQEQDVANRKAEVLLQVDRAYFNALGAQAILKVAQQTVEARQLVADQVDTLAASGLKSSLDASFARVNLSQAKLLLVEATNDVQAAFATLTAAIGSTQVAIYDLQDEPLAPPPPDDDRSLVAQGLRDRPDIAARRFSRDAAAKFAAAERALWFPVVSAVGAAGVTPYRQTGLTDHYSAAGFNVAVPLTNGNLYSARHAEALLRAQAEEETVREIEAEVTRDVSIAWLSARTAYQKMDLTNQLLTQASDALELAQARYDLGLSSIVELTQAQLNKTAAEIEVARTRYDFQARSVALRFQIGALR